MTTPQTLRDLRDRLEHPTTESINGVSRFAVLSLLDRLEAAERALREVPWWPLYDSAHGDPRSEQLNDWYEKHGDLIRRISQPHSAEGGRDE